MLPYVYEAIRPVRNQQQVDKDNWFMRFADNHPFWIMPIVLGSWFSYMGGLGTWIKFMN